MAISNDIEKSTDAAAGDAVAAKPSEALLISHRSVFWCCFWLAIIFCVGKILQPQDPYDHAPDTRLERLRDIAVICHQDVVFALAVGLLGQSFLILTANRPRLNRWSWRIFVASCVACVIYAVVSVPTFAYLGTPLTFGLIHVAGDFINMRSSLKEFLTPTLVAAVVSVPLVYLAMVWACGRLPRPRPRWWHWGLRLLGVAAIGVYFVMAHRVYDGEWSDRDNWRLAQNPHWTLAWTCAQQLWAGDSVHLAADFPPSFADEFQSAGQRSLSNPPATQALTRPKNVIVFVLESVGTQHLSLYGSPFPTMPRLQAEAEHELIFNNVYSHVGMTANSLVTILLSEFPPITWKQTTIEQPDFPGTSLAQVLHPLGYRTAYITSGDNGYVKTGRFLANRGFDEVWDEDQLNCPQIFTWGVEDRCMFDALLRWIDVAPARPFFALTWTQQTHHPYGVSENEPEIDFLNGQSVSGDDYHLNRYMNAIHEADRLIGKLIDELRRRNLADDTLIVITGDHGEGFGSPHKTYAHGERLYQECLNVPFVLWNPKLFQGRKRSDAIGGLIDLNPTVLDLLGIPAPPSWQGRSLLDPNHPPRTYFDAVNNDYLLGVRQNNWKYMFNATRGREQLFDLTKDPQELNSVDADHPDVCKELRQHLSAWINVGLHRPR